MALRLEELAKTIDHTLLGPEEAAGDRDRRYEEARAHHLASVCVLPGDVARAAEALRACDVKVSASIPLSGELAHACVAAGAAELDVALDVRALLAGDVWRVRDELRAVVRAASMCAVNAGRGQVLVKVALDCDRLDDKRKRLACALVDHVGADFASATTARTGIAALVEVELLRDALPDRVGVKAALEVRTAREASDLIGAGATRIGTPHGPAVLAGLADLRRAS